MKTALYLVFFILLALAVLSTGKPTPRTSTRSVSPQPHKPEKPEDVITSNVSGARYMLDQYYSFINDTMLDPITSRANIIRSLENVATAPSCSQFNFSLTFVNVGEKCIKSELHLYMKRKTPFSGPLYIVVRKLDKDSEMGDFITSREVVSTAEDSWLVFHMQDYMIDLIPQGIDNVLFKVEIMDYHGGQGILSCNDGPITFAYGPSEPDKAPYLTLHTLDDRININYDDIRAIIEENPQINGGELTTRRKRNSGTSPSCQKNPLIINSSELTKFKFVESEISFPTTIDLGICGGTCSNALPKADAIPHSLLSHLAVASLAHDYQTPPGGVIKQCCAPTQYATQSIIVQPERGGVDIVRLKDLKISKCECVEVVEFTPTSRD